MAVYMLNDQLWFPDPSLADPGGLLALGGDMRIERLILAYENGIFPWFNPDDPILWWAPELRLVLYPSRFYCSKSLRKEIRDETFEIKMDTAFEKVIQGCRDTKRKEDSGTWISDAFVHSYTELYELGLAHSVEAWHNQELVGGLYGISMGKAFFGESMFSKKSNASKVALWALSQWCVKHDFKMIDCQLPTDHLKSLGAEEVPRAQFMKEIYEALEHTDLSGKWHYEINSNEAAR